MDFQASPPVDLDEDELCFDGPELDAVKPAPVKPPRKRMAKGKGATEPVEEPVAEAERAPEPTAPEPIATDAATGPVILQPIASKIATSAMVLAVVASLLSAVGVLVTSRNLAALHAEREAATGQAAALDRLPALLARIDRLAAKQETALAAHAPDDPLTRTDLNAAIDGLKLSLAKQQPVGTAALAGTVRQGQNELSLRIDELRRRLDAGEPGRRPAGH